MPEEILESPQPVQPTEPKITNWPKIVLVAVLGLGLLVSAAYAGYWYGTASAKLKSQSPASSVGGQPKTQIEPSPTPTSTPAPATQTEEVEEILRDLTLRKLQFQIPMSWWYKQEKNEWYPIEWFDINPTSIDPILALPAFLVRVDEEDITLQQKEEDLVEMWNLIDTQEQFIQTSEVEGIKLAGRVDPSANNYNSRFAGNAKVKLAVFRLDNETYQLLGDVTQYEKGFDQILSTFKFLD